MPASAFAQSGPENHWLSWYGLSLTTALTYSVRSFAHCSQTSRACLPSVVCGKSAIVRGARVGIAADVWAGGLNTGACDMADGAASRLSPALAQALSTAI